MKVGRGWRFEGTKGGGGCGWQNGEQASDIASGVFVSSLEICVSWCIINGMLSPAACCSTWVISIERDNRLRNLGAPLEGFSESSRVARAKISHSVGQLVSSWVATPGTSSISFASERRALLKHHYTVSSSRSLLSGKGSRRSSQTHSWRAARAGHDALAL